MLMATPHSPYKTQRLQRFVSLGGLLAICLLAASCYSEARRDPPSARLPAAASSGAADGTADQAEPAAGASYGTSAEFDPIEANGPIFEGWPEPRLALVITGQQQGYLEPCGCAGLENQKGGLSRRQGMIDQLLDRNWPVLAVDVGGQVRRFGRQPEMKFHTTVEALRTMGYEAVALGSSELRLPTEELVAAVAQVDAAAASPFVSANVGLFGFEAELTPRWKVVERHGIKVGITAVLGDQAAASIRKDDLEIRAATDALPEIVDELLEQQCQFLILLAHAEQDEVRALAERFPEFDLVVCSAGADEPPAQPVVVASQSWLVEVGHKGMYAVVVGLYDDPQTPARYQRVPLDARFGDAPEMRQLMAAYQEQLRNLGFAGLGLQPAQHPRAAGGGELDGVYAGAESCAKCHTKAHAVWSKSAHAHATETLTKLDPPRQFDPECISCHATGWHPQEYFPYASGYESMESTPLLVGNSCENCHGPAAAHVSAEQARGADRDLARRDRLRQELRLTKAMAEQRVCANCHDLDNSPAFKFDQYWPKVEHRGKD